MEEMWSWIQQTQPVPARVVVAEETVPIPAAATASRVN
jgi:hypothetical protein